MCQNVEHTFFVSTLYMNLYLRYFDLETLVTDVEDAIDFLASIPEIQMDDRIADDVRDFYNSDMRYPKRYKVRPRIYFIMIKTEAATMQDFKDKKALAVAPQETTEAPVMSMREQRERENHDIMERLNSVREGWYEAEVRFKRVVTIPATGKHEYRDCDFSAYVKASTPQECYNRLIDELSHRVDPRSQFPSVKGRNFRYSYVGKCKPLKEA